MTATKTKPTKTREEELAEQLGQHRSMINALRDQADAWEQAAAELDASAEAKIADFDGPVTELPKGVDEARSNAQLKRQGASDLRARAEAYAAKVELAAIAAEHDQLREERIAAEQLEAATEEAEALMAEADTRAAWLYRDSIAAAAVRARYLEVGNRLMDLVRQQPGLKVDAGRYTTLAVRAQELAIQHQQLIASSGDPELWRRNLPELKRLNLPAELRAPGGIRSQSRANGSPAADQPRTRIGMTFGVRPSQRNPDGTAVGAMVDPFNPTRHAPVPRTEAEERAKRKELAAVAALEDGADG